jgi:ataxia telangiectasia mutated family protein
MTPEDFRKGIRELQEKEAPASQMAKRWQDQMKKFKPVMRHFFVERHKEPMAWLTMRLAYARSTAVSSMVGHMVGLGDRHCSNILIDRVSGELVHIDLGIAFDEASLHTGQADQTGARAAHTGKSTLSPD